MAKSAPELIVPASLWRRLAAAVYDSLLMAGIIMIATAVVLPLVPGNEVKPGALWFQAWLISVCFAFFGFSWVRGGQTLGMRAWRLKLRNQQAQDINWTTAAIRYIGCWLTWLPAGLGMLMCLFDPQRRALHDILAGTEVVVLPKKKKQQ